LNAMIAADRTWCNGCRGFSYVLLLFMVALTGWALAGVAQVWHTLSIREKEAELLFIGKQFRDAIMRYAASSPGTPQYPKKLEDLLHDPRFPQIRRHLRQIYVDPMTGKANWGLVTGPDGVVLGVHSLSEDTPVKVAGFPADEEFSTAKSYAEGKFVAVPQDAASSPIAPLGVTPGPVPRAASGLTSAAGEPVSPPVSPEAQCNSQRLADLRICSNLTQEPGEDAAAMAGMRARCMQSAIARSRGCLAGASTPPLETTAR